MSYLPPKGTEDFYPLEWSVRLKVLESLRATALKYGYSEVDTPAFETTEWLTKKSGEEVLGQIFTLEQRGSEKFGLRFDLTIPMTRLFLQKQRELSKPVRWFGLSKMWRYEAPQKGRLREFSQLSVECYGSERVEADAELLNLFIDCFRSFGLTSNDFKVFVNDRKLLQEIVMDVGGVSSKEQCENVFRSIDKSSKISPEAFLEDLQKAGLSESSARTLKDIVGLRGSPSVVIPQLKALNISSVEFQESLGRLERLFSLISSEFVELDLSIARGLAYYTGIVFEAFDVGREFRALGGGGRYDELISLYGGESTSATGFGIGLSTLSLFLEKKGLLPAPAVGVDYYVAPVSEDLVGKAIDIARDLRSKASVVVDVNARKLSKQFEYAQRIGAKSVVIVGEKDLKDGVVTVRDMVTGKERKEKV